MIMKRTYGRIGCCAVLKSKSPVSPRSSWLDVGDTGRLSLYAITVAIMAVAAGGLLALNNGLHEV